MSQQTKTVNITPLHMRMPKIIEFYNCLNDVGKMQFILTFPEEDRQPIIDAYEKYHNSIGTPNAK